MEEEGKRQGFWRRQFAVEMSNRQLVFDIVFGVALPTVSAALDPLVFKGGLGKGPLLGSVRAFAYVLSFVSIWAMTAWLLGARKNKYFCMAVSGMFLVGGVISFGIGILIVPFSLIGLALYGFGAFGFVPLFAGFVYLRNGVRSFKVATGLSRVLRVSAFVVSCIASLGIPYAINVRINSYLDEMVKGDAATIYSHGRTLRYIYPLINADALGGQYCHDSNSPEHIALGDVYWELTGKSIEGVDFHICEDW